jgi:hypothetical protein
MDDGDERPSSLIAEIKPHVSFLQFTLPTMATTLCHSRLHLVLLVAHCAYIASGFVTAKASRWKHHDACFANHLDSATTEDVAAPKKQANLTFLVELSVSSDPLPAETTTEQIKVFLEDMETRKLMLSTGKSREVQLVPMSPELTSLWNEQCQQEYGEANLPGSPDDCILATDVITRLPGLRLNNKIYNGVKKSTNDAGIPQYTFLMIGEKQSVKGPAPLVWIFNKLTGAEKKKDPSLKPSGVAKSDVAVINNQDGSLAIRYDVSIKITVTFPAVLLKILPTTKEKAEASASASIRKGLQKDVENGAKGVYDGFLEFQKAQLKVDVDED